ncbi:MAG: SDR family oxidoreductase [Terricaulis sp.]
MSFDPINPVALIASAATGVGAACARELAQRADGGLILADPDEAALEACADSLDRAPERVSTLAFNPADPTRWTDAADFIAAHYGRLDWALIDAGAAFPRHEGYLEYTQRGLEAIMPLIGDNRDGGAIVLMTSAAVLSEELRAGAEGGLMDLLRETARRGDRRQVRVGALAFGNPQAEMWTETPLFDDMIREHGGIANAFSQIAQTAPPIVRHPGASLASLIPMMISEASGGGVLVVDGGHTL